MCGRFSLVIDSFKISERFDVPQNIPDWIPRYNIAPTQPYPVIIQESGNRRAEMMQWGLVPHWSKEKKSGAPLINARAETLASKPSFYKLLQSKRCLIPADGFYEWKKSSSGKIPYRIVLRNGEPFAFAGLWDLCVFENGEQLRTFTIITIAAHEIVNQFHDRMPLILIKENEEKWLDSSISDYSQIQSLFVTYPASSFRIYEVPGAVNSWKNDVPECIQES